MPGSSDILQPANRMAFLPFILPTTLLTPQVDDHRREGTRILFPIISMFLLMSMVMATVGPYTLLSQGSFSGSVLLLLLMSYYQLADFYHLGETFVGQVRQVVQA